VATSAGVIRYLAKQQILGEDALLLGQVEQAVESRYRNGMGNQQDVLQAQLERTKLLREINMNELEQGKTHAELKNLLNRSQTSTDIATAELSESTLAHDFDQLLARAGANNPDLAGMRCGMRATEISFDRRRLKSAGAGYAPRKPSQVQRRVAHRARRANLPL
jgi:outer membrane protein TolC